MHDIPAAEAGELCGARLAVQTTVSSSTSLLDTMKLAIGLYPENTPGADCHIAVDSRPCHSLGAVYTPGTVLHEGLTIHPQFFNDPFMFCHTPIAGAWVAMKSIGGEVAENEPLGKIDDIEIRSPYAGQVWGLVHSGRLLEARSPVAMILQGESLDACFEIGYRERAVAGGVLEALLRHGS